MYGSRSTSLRLPHLHSGAGYSVKSLSPVVDVTLCPPGAPTTQCLDPCRCGPRSRRQQHQAVTQSDRWMLVSMASPSGGGSGTAHKTVKGEQEEAARESPPPSGWLQRIPHVPPTGHTGKEAGGIGLQEPKMPVWSTRQ
ncbi:hypothetical protein MHYP_G00224270 [Metynnis hypsauchen]